MSNYTNRIIILVDMDCFYCQVEEKLDPNLAGKPIAVVQYNAWRGGGIIAVNYPAREKGVTRHMRGNEAKQKCPEIVLARVPQVRGKADLTKYREAGKDVADILKTFTPLLERASVDEAYLDITDIVNKRMTTDFEQVNMNNMKNSYAVGWVMEDFLHNVHRNKDYAESNSKLAMGGLIAEEIRAEIFKKTGYKCSAGIAHNKILAKIVCGLHKPNKQTLMPQESVSELYRELPIGKVKRLGGKFGNALSQKLNITTMGELYKFSERELAARFDDKNAKWLYNIARGIDLEPVSVRLVSKSIGCCKKFPGKSALITPEEVSHWMNEFALEITERLEKDLEENNRRAKQMIISFAQEVKGKDVSSSRTIPLVSYDQSKVVQSGLNVLKKFCLKSDGTYNIKYLGISVGNFEEIKKMPNINSFFKNMTNSCSSEECEQEIKTNKAEENSQIMEQTNISKEANEENSVDDANTSIYSATTEELNEDTKSLIYYEDIYPESVASQPILERKSPCDDMQVEDDEINEVLSNRCNLNDIDKGQTSNSFFTKYFESVTDESSKSPIRNFDTSKGLDLDSSTDENETSNEDTPYEEKVNVLEKNLSPILGAREKEESDIMETCSECNKKILPWELVSHMDYHYALKIVKDEAHLYKPTPSIFQKNNAKKENGAQGIKRKAEGETKDTKPILAFLRKDDLNEENSALCDECNKRIKLEEVVSHADYHAAKKLHLEINSCPSIVNRSKGEKGQTKNKKSKETSKMLDFFFKPS